MDATSVRDILSGRRRDLTARAARAGLTLPACLYGLAMGARRWAHRHGLLPGREAPLPVVCVGNLTTGGTGKTPMVEWTVQRLRELGHTPAVLTRGYAGQPGQDAEPGFSDEAELLRAITGAPVMVHADRLAGARRACAAGATVAVMDDGFQHLRLRRALDVVLIDATCPFGFDWPLPRGLLREPPRALADAGAVVITRADAVGAHDLARLQERIERLARGAPQALAIHRPSAAIDPMGRKLPPETLAGRRLAAFCGLGNPEAFFAALEGIGVELAGRLALADHARYDPADRAAVQQLAERTAAELITTEKDGTKLARAPLASAPWQLAVRMEVVQGRPELLEALAEAVGSPASG